jgi:hypothetical protein
LRWAKADIALAGSELLNKKTNKRMRWDELLTGVGRAINGEGGQSR